MATAKLSPSPLRMTFEEYLEWADEDSRTEWIDGEVEFMSPSSAEHQYLEGFLLALLRFFVEMHGLGRMFGPEFVMRVRAIPAGREPDLFFVANANLSHLQKNYYDGPADLAMDIVSPESQVRDRDVKKAEYERGGVGEYWLIDPLLRQATFYELQADGTYRVAPIGEDGLYRSTVIAGLWINTNWLWQRPLPTLLSVLQQWGWELANPA